MGVNGERKKTQVARKTKNGFRETGGEIRGVCQKGGTMLTAAERGAVISRKKSRRQNLKRLKYEQVSRNF